MKFKYIEHLIITHRNFLGQICRDNLGKKINKMKAFTSGVPVQISRMWSQMALAADMALDSFLALMTAAPLCCTVCSPRV